MKLFLSIVILAVVFFTSYIIYFCWIYYWEPNPAETNFIGESRLEVINWMEQNAKFFKNNKTNIKGFKIGPDGTYFYSKEDLLDDKYFMSLDEWLIGYEKLHSGIYFVYLLKFKDDVVISQCAYRERSL